VIKYNQRMPSTHSPLNPKNDRREYDVIIVGAGPAGISTALHLAKLAPELIPRTLILEKMRHPRPKLCGGGVLPDGEAILEGLGLDIREVPHCDVDWAHFDYAGQGFKMRGEKEGTFAFRTIRRREFDAWLAGKARRLGFQIHEETNVTHLEVDGIGVTLETSRGRYRARVIVGADGSNSIVRRFVVPREKAHVARLLEVVTEPKPETSFHTQADSYFDFFVVPQGIQGYVWDFPAVEEGKPVRVRGIFDSNCLENETGIPLRAALSEEFRRHGLDLEAYKLEGFPIRWFEPRAACSAPHLLLAGDAAGADALYGEGISLALGYGGFAARAIQDAFARQDFTFSGYQPALLRSEMGKALVLRTWLARWFYRFHFAPIQAFFWRRLGRAVRWVVRYFVIGWARRQETKEDK
jgi:flavin-dependent dehydrogenase